MTLQWVATYLVLPCLALALALGFVRLARGPSLPDRVVAMELVAAVAVGMLSVTAVVTGESLYIDVGVVVALIGFLGVVSVATYLERRVQK